MLQPFEQVESSLSRTHNGTGLGLPLSAAMMTLHGGTLAIDSEIEQAARPSPSPSRARASSMRGEDGAADALALDAATEPGADREPQRYSYG